MEQFLKDTAHNVIPFSTVHGVKGLEFPAVTLVLPARPRTDEGLSRTAVDDWEYDAATEARRVLYVGVSRAQRLCILAVPDASTERVAKLLARDAVPYRLECTCFSR